MTMTNAEWCMKNGIQFRKVGRMPCSDPDYESIGYYDTYGNFNECYKGKCLGNLVSESILTWLDMEHKEQILDDAEKRYLSTVIRPFRNEIKAIEKDNYLANKLERIYFFTKEGELFYLKSFKANTMYKGMEQKRQYTLEELGI